MATGDIRAHDWGARTNPLVRRFTTRAGKTAINAGEPVALDVNFGISGQYVIALTTNKPVVNTDYFVGVAATAGTHTASANGYVDVYLDGPGVIWKAKALTASTANTQGQIDSSMLYTVAFDLTTSTYTVNTTNTAGAGLMIVGGDPDRAEVFFICKDSARFSR